MSERTRPRLAPCLRLALAGLLLLPAACERSAPPPEEAIVFPVEVRVVEPHALHETSDLSGVLAAYRAVDVVAEVGGTIEVIRRDVGDRVARKEVLAAVEKKVLRETHNQTAAALTAARARYEVARDDFGRDSTLYAGGDIAQAAFAASRMTRTAARADRDGAQAAHELAARSLANADITAPFAGFVSRRHCEIGTFVSPGLPLFRLVDIDSLRLVLSVAQQNAMRLKPGGTVTLTAEALPGSTFAGRIRSIAPEADAQTRTFPVEVVLANPAGCPLRDGLIVRATLTLRTLHDVLAVPREAVVRHSTGHFVYVAGDSTVTRRPVTLGPLVANEYAIPAGLEPGEAVVVVGMQNLRDGAPIRIEARRTSPATEEEDR